MFAEQTRAATEGVLKYSAVQLSFDVSRSAVLPEAVRRRLLELAGSRVSKDGILLITARQFREQERNRADARARLAALIRAAANPPKPRHATRVPRAQKKQRLETKKRTAMVKRKPRPAAWRLFGVRASAPAIVIKVIMIGVRSVES